MFCGRLPSSPTAGNAFCDELQAVGGVDGVEKMSPSGALFENGDTDGREKRIAGRGREGEGVRGVRSVEGESTGVCETGDRQGAASESLANAPVSQTPLPESKRFGVDRWDGDGVCALRSAAARSPDHAMLGDEARAVRGSEKSSAKEDRSGSGESVLSSRGISGRAHRPSGRATKAETSSRRPLGGIVAGQQ